ncbi:MAG: hypothetical protein AAFX06_05070 [Planctomycetota bacterium]
MRTKRATGASSFAVGWQIIALGASFFLLTYILLLLEFSRTYDPEVNNPQGIGVVVWVGGVCFALGLMLGCGMMLFGESRSRHSLRAMQRDGVARVSPSESLTCPDMLTKRFLF